MKYANSYPQSIDTGDTTSFCGSCSHILRPGNYNWCPVFNSVVEEFDGDKVRLKECHDAFRDVVE